MTSLTARLSLFFAQNRNLNDVVQTDRPKRLNCPNAAQAVVAPVTTACRQKVHELCPLPDTCGCACHGSPVPARSTVAERNPLPGSTRSIEEEPGGQRGLAGSGPSDAAMHGRRRRPLALLPMTCDDPPLERGADAEQKGQRRMSTVQRIVQRRGRR